MSILENSQIHRLLDVAFAVAHKGQISKANTILNALLEAKPDFSPALIGLGLTSFMVDDFAKGEEIIDKVLQANPDDSEALAILALGMFLAGEFEKAKVAASKITDSGSQTAQTALLATEILELV